MERWPGHQRYILIKDRCCAIGVVNPQLQQRLSAENIGWVLGTPLLCTQRE